MSDPTPIKTLDLVVPSGPVNKGMRQMIAESVAKQLKEGETAALIALVDAEGKEIKGSVTFVAKNKKGDFALTTTAAWDQGFKAQVGVIKTW